MTSTSDNSTATSTPTPIPDNKPNVGVIAGGVVGGVVFLLILGAIIFIILRKRSQKKRDTAAAAAANPPFSAASELPSYDESKIKSAVEVSSASGGLDFTPYRPYENSHQTDPAELQAEGQDILRPLSTNTVTTGVSVDPYSVSAPGTPGLPYDSPTLEMAQVIERKPVGATGGSQRRSEVSTASGRLSRQSEVSGVSG